MPSAAEVKKLIPHTWPLFFARHGRFTPIQQQAIPSIAAGNDTLVVSATASGKTEAVIAPLLERNWDGVKHPSDHGLTLLYICPTRALVRDLYERLFPLLADTDITVGIKTGDTGPLDEERPFSILLTTPESTDSLLTRMPRLFISLQAIVLDEIHLFDNTSRGDHTRCLLERIEHIRQYARSDAGFMQRVVLSATVPDLEGVAQRYLHNGVIVHVSSGREIQAEVWPLYDLAELVTALAQRAEQKSLVFCNSKDKVERTAAYLGQHLPHHAQVFVHYSNLDAELRLDVETRFAEASVAVCVCTSTLELGIDIGSIDDVVLLGAPFNLNSFLQRIGRGGRRTEKNRVLCLPRSPGEWARFEALLSLANAAEDAGTEKVEDVRVYGFRPSVLVQQIFSLIKQNPTGSIRPADVRRIAPAEVSDEAIRDILTQLSFARYLQPGRLGEWKPDVELQELIDRHELYSNIGTDPLLMTAVDAFSGKVIAQTDRAYRKGTVVLFGGNPMVVAWREKYRFGLAPAVNRVAEEVLSFHKAHAAIPFVVTQIVARELNFQAHEMAFLRDGDEMLLFHFWGTLWGQLLTNILVANGIVAEFVNEYCLSVQPDIDKLPEWDDALGERVMKRAGDTLSERLQMGRFHKLLPRIVGQTAVIGLLNLKGFRRFYRETMLVSGEKVRERLLLLAG